MVIFYLVAGIGAGTVMAATSLMFGNTLWSALIFYAGGGSLSVLWLARLMWTLPDTFDAYVDGKSETRLQAASRSDGPPKAAQAFWCP